MEEIQVDLAVVGSGPAGQKGAIQGAKLGKRVVVVEREQDPGGTCLYSGTIPSKTLREAILDLTGFQEHSFYGKDYPLKEVNISDLNYRLNRVIDEEKALIQRQFLRNGVGLVEGTACFDDPNTLLVISNDGTVRYKINASHILIAPGSNPRNPQNVPFDNDVILDSTRLLSISKLPKSMLVLGGGIIGSEYASFFAPLGVDVTIIDKKTHLLPMLDNEMGQYLQKSLSEIGLKFIGMKEPEEIKRVDNHACVKFKDGTALEADVLLYALGRVANVTSLKIEKAGLTVNDKGYIPVNALFQTVVPHIYAAGDVIGGPCLASTSMEQARLAVRHACNAETHRFPSAYPTGIWTIPEISSCGYTEEELIGLGFRYEVGRAYYYEIARSHITGNKVGMFKILFHADTLEILGVHVVGNAANEVIHIGEMAMGNRAKVDCFIDQVFNYPSYAEGYRIAALNGINKIKRLR